MSTSVQGTYLVGVTHVTYGLNNTIENVNADCVKETTINSKCRKQPKDTNGSSILKLEACFWSVTLDLEFWISNIESRI